MRTYIKFLSRIYLNSFLYVSLVMLSLIFILNLLSELDFFSGSEVNQGAVWKWRGSACWVEVRWIMLSGESNVSYGASQSKCPRIFVLKWGNFGASWCNVALVSGNTAPIVVSTAPATKILSGFVHILKLWGYCECRKSLMMEIKIRKN